MTQLLVSRRTTEKAVLTAVRERLSDPASIHYLLQRVEAEVEQLHAYLPQEIELKRAALASEERRIANYIDFIGGGKGTRALGEALSAAEQKAESLRAELQARLIPVASEVGRSYYKAEPDWLRWWRRWELNPRPETLSTRRLRR